MRTFPALLLSLALALTGAVSSGPAHADPRDPDDPHTWQTSDRVPGRVAPTLPSFQRSSSEVKQLWRYQASRGVRVSKWAHLSPRGRVRFFVVRVWWNTPGLEVDYAHAPKVRRTEPLSTMLGRTRNVMAGVNGDFFDIGDTGAPLGLGRARGKGLIHGIDYGWNSAFWVPEKGAPQIDRLTMMAEVRGRDIRVTNLNSPQVKPNGIGIYTPDWGRASGTRWVDGHTRYARVVHVKGHRVLSNTTSAFPRGEFKGYYLVARGERQRRQLAGLKVGQEVRVRRYLPVRTSMAITGNAILLQDGRRLVTDDGEMHPRTAVGIDRDRRQLILTVVDGRARQSRGYTMVELAQLMRRLGADDALNLDGGGSSTLVARNLGTLRVVNSPSDGYERHIPNGLQVTYTAPQGRTGR